MRAKRILPALSSKQDILADDKRAAGWEVGLSQPPPPSSTEKRGGSTKRVVLLRSNLAAATYSLPPAHFTTQELDAATVDNLGEQKGGGGDGRWQVSGHLSADSCPGWLIRAVSPRGAAVGMDTDPALTYSRIQG